MSRIDYARKLELTRNRWHLSNVQFVSDGQITMLTISEHELQDWGRGRCELSLMSCSPGFPHREEEDYTIVYKECLPTRGET